MSQKNDYIETADDFDALDADLAAFFGADRMRQAPWIRTWCNGRYAQPYEEDQYFHDQSHAGVPKFWHDSSLPPLTRIRDVGDWNLQWGLILADGTGSRSDDSPFLSAATIDIALTTNAVGRTEAMPYAGARLKPPPYTIVPVASCKCRGADTVGRARPDEVQFKIETRVYETTVSLGDDAVLRVPMAGGVFNARCKCSIVGMN